MANDEGIIKPVNQDFSTDPNVNYFGLANYRNQNRKFGIKIDDRRRHMYVVGKTGMGKTTLMENMVLSDIYAGHGVGVVDPHGDFAEKIINYIPAHRINDVVYFNPSDMDYPIGFNILETIRPEQKHLVASGLMGVFKKIWPDVWSARMEYILNNTILALLEYPNTTLLGINRLLADNSYRKKVVGNVKDPVIKSFWETEFANYNDKYKQEAVAPVQNKIGQFLSASVIRNIVAQVKSRINIREIMDNQKIFIMNLSKGRIGEDNSRLLGGMLVTKIQLSAMERVDIPEKDRKDFFLYVDEFQNFATESFANILSEARKYRLDLIMAHQYMEQLDETVLAAIIGNVGTTVSFRVGSTDAEILSKEFAPIFLENDLINLPKFQTYLKLMIDGVSSQPFSAATLPPIGSPTGSAEKVIRVTRERYATSRDKIEEKIIRWSGIDVGDYDDDDDDDGPPAPKTNIPVQTASASQPVYVNGVEVKKPAVQKFENKPKQKFEPPKNDFRKDDRKMPVNFNNKDKSGPRKDSFKKNINLDIKESSPVLSVDPNQKGISLAEALQTNRQPAAAKEPPRRPETVPKPIVATELPVMEQKPEDVVMPKMEIPVQTVITPKPDEQGEIMPESVLGLEDNKDVDANTEEKKILPDKIVKFDS